MKHKALRKLTICIMLCMTTMASNAQQTDLKIDSIPFFLQELKQAIKSHYDLWNMDEYSSLLLVDAETREVYANEPDNAGTLTKSGSLYKGTLPNEINIANTSIEWNGKTWAMIMLPLPDDRNQRITLLAHELFHKAQPALNFNIKEGNNVHLDTKDGRIYLRLELEALKCAVLSNTEKEREENLTNAFVFRKYRNQLFANSATDENNLELNEGLAEYTGQTIGGFKTKENWRKHFETEIEYFMTQPTYVRSFAYKTIPAYGYMASNVEKHWNRDVTSDTDLTDYFITLFKIKLPNDLEKRAQEAMSLYGGGNIVAEESQREEQKSKLIAGYRAKFIEQPHLEITLEQMQFTFDPRNVVPLDETSNVYPTMRIVDVWGILTVEGGGALLSNWQKVSVSKPSEINDNEIKGDGWHLQLNEGYAIKERNEGYMIEKK